MGHICNTLTIIWKKLFANNKTKERLIGLVQMTTLCELE